MHLVKPDEQEADVGGTVSGMKVLVGYGFVGWLAGWQAGCRTGRLASWLGDCLVSESAA